MTVYKNKAQCLLCGDRIESRYRHDFVACKCGNLSVDGGLDYIKRNCQDLSKYQEIHEEATKEDIELNNKYNKNYRGI